VANPDHAEGMGSSLRAGVRRVGESDAYLIALADMPAITPALIAALVACYRQRVAPSCCRSAGDAAGIP